jgi:hypothetical protein
VGTGKLCIQIAASLPLTAFLDIDAKSLKYAQENVSRNDLRARIRLLNSDPAGPLIPLDHMRMDRYKQNR